MSLIKPVRGFSFRLVLVYVMLIIPWPGLEEAYATLFRAGGTFVFGSFGSEGVVRFLQSDLPDNSTRDTLIVFSTRKPLHPNGYMRIKKTCTSSRYGGYIPTILVIALILATPISWLRRAWTLLWGMGLVHTFIAFRLLVKIFYLLSGDPEVPLFVLNPFWETVLNFAYDIFVFRLGSSFVIPIFIWILVTFRREDWKLLMQALDNTK